MMRSGQDPKATGIFLKGATLIRLTFSEDDSTMTFALGHLNR